MTKHFLFRIIILPACILLIAPVILTAQSPDKTNSVTVTAILNNYTYPTGISTDGTYVVGTYFGGGASYFWSNPTGTIPISGTPYGISDNGLVAGTFSNPAVLYNGNNVETAGTWEHTTSQWTFLGMNPTVPIFAVDYNTGWDITADGLTVVGMQWLPGYDVSAFQWTSAGGYQMIGNGVGQGSRASGISANGLVVYGWAETTSTSRTPVVWYNNQAILINSSQPGEGFGASTAGNYVTGTVGSQGFRWSPQGTVQFSNTLNVGSINPSTVLNNGTVFGYTDTSWPPNPTARRAFARDSLGTLMTFNDYAEARGLPNAQQWIFYSINDATADGNTLLGSGKTPEGQNITFIMKFIEELPLISASPQSINFGEVQVGTITPYQTVTIKNGGGGSLQLSSTSLGGANVSQFVLQDNNQYPHSLAYGDSITVLVAFAPASDGSKAATLDISAPGSSLQVPLTGIGKVGVTVAEVLQDRFTVFPNPACKFLSVQLPEKAESLRLYNMAGQVLLNYPVNDQSRHTVDLAGFPNGLSHLRCIMAGGSALAIPVVIEN